MSLTAGRPSKGKAKSDDLATLDNPQMVRVNFNLEKDKHIELKKYAIENNKTMTQLLTELVDDVLGR